MTADRWIAIIALAICAVYGYAAYHYPLMPFERHMAFKPNSLPLVLSGLGALISLVILVGSSPKKAGEAAEAGSVDIDWRRLHEYKLGQAIAILLAMTAYAMLLRPIGFIAATVLFLAGGGAILGERRFHILIPVALVGALVVWLLVQELLGIYMRPLPAVLGL